MNKLLDILTPSEIFLLTKLVVNDETLKNKIHEFALEYEKQLQFYTNLSNVEITPSSEKVIQECISELEKYHNSLPKPKNDSDDGYSRGIANSINILSLKLGLKFKHPV